MTVTTCGPEAHRDVDSCLAFGHPTVRQHLSSCGHLQVASGPMQLTCLAGVMPMLASLILLSYFMEGRLMALPGSWAQQLCEVQPKTQASVCFYGLVTNL